ncbi:MAG: sugar transferase [Pyrinomonadaceae bacterium]|nr:sugar transferase [Acidobacteriota bacterium]MBK7931937.1 sugar transferase [Acidobacteriota bacterium]MBP7376937.1 sugar transferase [Pyrinomonadaceae bacterium]
MKERLRASLLFLYRILDLSALSFALWISFKYGGPIGMDYVMLAVYAPTFDSVLFFGGVFASWIFMLSSFWLYRSKRLASLSDELTDVFRAVVFATLILATLILLAEWSIFPKRFLVIFAFVSFVLLFSIRLLKRTLLQQFRLHGRNLRSVVVIGAGPRGRKLVDLIDEHPEIGYQFLGFIDDLKGPGVIGKLSDIPKILAQNVIDEVIICLPIKSYYEQIQSITAAAEEQGITVRIYSDLFNLNLSRAVAGEIGQAPILSIYASRLTDWQAFVKSSIDFAGGLVLLVVLSPVMLVIALMIKLTSPGPVFFVQERVGLNKRRFNMFKFRTMVADAPARQAELEKLNEADGPVFKIKNDPRVTKLGVWLRKTSLDELPQLFNILLGDLSLVGPRPLPERDFQRFDKHWFNRRFSVKPGITCIWQISGRSETSFDKWIIQDLEYIEKWSLALDLKILFKTVPTVLRGTGAM